MIINKRRKNRGTNKILKLQILVWDQSFLILTDDQRWYLHKKNNKMIKIKAKDK